MTRMRSTRKDIGRSYKDIHICICVYSNTTQFVWNAESASLHRLSTKA